MAFLALIARGRSDPASCDEGDTSALLATRSVTVSVRDVQRDHSSKEIQKPALQDTRQAAFYSLHALVQLATTAEAWRGTTTMAAAPFVFIALASCCVCACACSVVSRRDKPPEAAASEVWVRTGRDHLGKPRPEHRLAQLFRELDDLNQNDNSPEGYVSLPDLRQAMADPRFAGEFARMGLSAERVQTIFSLCDTSNTGLVDIDQFVSGMEDLGLKAPS